RAAAGGGHAGARARARRADPPRGGRDEPRGSPAARLRRSRPRVQRGGGRHQGALPVPEIQLDADRNVRRDREVGRARRCLHSLVQLHGTVHHAPAHGARARPAREQASLHRAARHRRLLRDQEVDASTVMTNKSLTGPNRGYACGHLYFETEGMIDRLADRLGMDPAEVRRRNLIPSGAMPYRTPTGGLYDSGDYPAAFEKALEIAKYTELRREQAKARAASRYVGIGLALAVDPSVSNMGYVATALDPQFRAKPEYLPTSGAVDSATVKIDPLGRVTAILGTTPQGQGHQTVVSQIVADELGLTPEEITVVDEMDTFTRVWSISSGTYSSRFGSVGTSAVALAARKLKAKLVEYGAHLLGVPKEQLEFRDGAVRPTTGKGPSYSIKDLAGRAHWNTESLPEGMEPGLQATAVFGFTVSKAVDAEDRVNSSNTYGFIAEVM